MTDEIKGVDCKAFNDDEKNQQQEASCFGCVIIVLVSLVVGVGCLRLFGMFARWIFS